jgi:hypothetical protein
MSDDSATARPRAADDRHPDEAVLAVVGSTPTPAAHRRQCAQGLPVSRGEDMTLWHPGSRRVEHWLSKQHRDAFPHFLAWTVILLGCAALLALI